VRLHVVHWLEGSLRGDIADLLAPSWFMCVGLAGLVSLILMLVLGRRRGMDTGTIASAVVWCYVAAILAGIIVPMVLDGTEHLVTTGRFHLRWAGMTSFWGYLAGGAAVALACKRDGVSLGRMGDLAVIPLGVALAFARLGCFMAGCDYGKVSSLPWAVRFPAGSPAWHDHVRAGLIPADRAASLPVHPTQLYEAMLGLAIVVIALYAARRKRKDGHLFVIAAASYAIGRLVIETLRGDAGRGIHAGLSSGQIFSMLVLLAIAARFVVANRRAARSAVTAAAFVLVIANVGEADAEPAPQPPPEQPQVDSQQPVDPQQPVVPQQPLDSQQQPDSQEPLDSQQQPPATVPDLAARPRFSTGVLFGVATPLNRRAAQVPTLAGPSISLGYSPGRFGVWLDLDSYANTDATHGTLAVSGSFTQRLSPRLVVGGRFGLGMTEVNFKDPAFRDVAGTTVRLEAIAEVVLARHWALWVRPLTIDTVSSADLGGPIMTYQFRIGVAYRFGSPPAVAMPTMGSP
jgi:phosphatidylglycerol:prolipoprotein diacylglycerol transferase